MFCGLNILPAYDYAQNIVSNKRKMERSTFNNFCCTTKQLDRIWWMAKTSDVENKRSPSPEKTTGQSILYEKQGIGLICELFRPSGRANNKLLLTHAEAGWTQITCFDMMSSDSSWLHNKLPFTVKWLWWDVDVTKWELACRPPGSPQIWVRVYTSSRTKTKPCF